LSGTNDRATVRLEWVVVAGVAGAAVVFAVPRMSGGDHDAHGQILQRLKHAAEENVSLVHAQAVVLGRPAQLTVGGETIRLLDGYPRADDLPKLLSGLNELQVEMHTNTLHVHVPTARDPAHCTLVYSVGPAPATEALVTVDDEGC
jgi:hypothetical protein